MLAIETDFFEKYLRFYDDIQRHVPYRKNREQPSGPDPVFSERSP